MQALQGRSILVTGASSGIGAATARLLAGAGARVTLLARRPDRLQQVAADCPDSRLIAADVTDWPAIERACASATYDAVIANAGLARGVDALQSGAPADWSEVVDTNIKGVLHVIRATLPAMQARGRGDLVLLGSVAGRQVYPGGGVYCATKHAVRALYEGLRLDDPGSGVRYATIDPGLVRTEFGLVRFRGDADKACAPYKGMQPLIPEDVAEAILWVLSRPPHVNIGELVLWPTAQASTTKVHRKG
jgi:3-hydroxy acid dehydrogenase / malonic semialdehyde reductase